MFPVGGTEFPKDNATLLAALADGVRPLGVSADAVALDGSFPSFEQISIELTGARFRRDHRPRPAPQETVVGFETRRLEIRANPAHAETLPFHLDVRGSDCVFGFGRAADGAGAFALRSAAACTVEASAALADIEAAVRAAAGEAVAAQGASIHSVQIELESAGSRSLAFSAKVTARAVMFSATLTLKGRIDIDDAFNARLSGLACSGEGMMATLAATALRPRLAQWEGASAPLSRFIPRGLVPEDIALYGNRESGLSIRLQLAAARTDGAAESQR